jgi:hypothetical protein
MATLQPGEQARLYALAKVGRAGATRSGYLSSRVFLTIDGISYMPPREPGHIGILLDSLTIQDELDDTPNTCSFRVNGAVPAVGSEVILTLGSQNNGTRLFAGFALTVRQLYVADKPANVQADCACVDYTWLFNFLQVSRSYRNQSASAIAADLVATYAADNGFTAAAVAPQLPLVDELTFANEDLGEAFTRLARRIGGYWYVDYAKRVHLFIEEAAEWGAPPEALTPTHRSLDDFTTSRERTQGLTRVYVEALGTTVLTPTLAQPGDTVIVAVESVEGFEPAADVFLTVAPQGSDGGSQRLTFTSVEPGGMGALVGPGLGPTNAPTLGLADGAGVTPGTHSYAYTWATSSGETFVSPLQSIITGTPIPNPTAGMGVPWNAPDGSYNGSYIPIGDTLTWAYAYSTTPIGTPLPAAQWPITLIGPVSYPITTVSNQDPLNPAMSAPCSCEISTTTDTRVQSIVVFLWSQAHAKWGRHSSFANTGTKVVATTRYGNYPIYEGPNWVPLPTANTTGTQNRVTVGVPTYTPDPTRGVTPLQAVSGRKIYRTAANASQLKLLATLADNTTTTYLDSLADAALGANAPTTDTSGLQADGQVPAGANALVVSGTSPFRPAGGIAIVGNGRLYITYEGIDGNNLLVGIPRTGPGSITSTLAFNTSVTAPAMLIGVGGLTEPLTNGDEIYQVVQRDHAPRQTELAAMVKVGPGIRAEYIQDRSLSVVEARARAEATLVVRPLEQVTVTYTCRDTRTASGKSITVNLPAPTNVSGTFKIQSVTIDHFRPSPTQLPTYTVTASSRRFSFEDWLRRMETSV